MNSTIQAFEMQSSLLGNEQQQLNEELSLIEFYLNICDKLLKIYPIVLLAIGTFGNLISFIVLMYGSRKKSTTFSYLSCLALIDLAVIATFSANFISLFNFGRDLQNNLVFCKFYAFFIYYLPQYSAWTLSIVSVDRMLALLQVNITHRYSAHNTTPMQSPRLPRNGVIATANNTKNGVKNSWCCFLTYFCKKRYKSTTTTSIVATPATDGDLKKKFCLFKCFNSIVSLYNFRISEKYRAFVIVSVMGVLLLVLNSHFLFIYTNNSHENENFMQNLTDLNNRSSSSLNTIEHLVKRERLTESGLMILFNGVNVIKCSLEHNPKYKELYEIWAHVDSIINVYFPFAVMIISSVMIIMCVLKSMKAAGNYRYHKIARNISVMLVSLNFMFIALTAPIVIQLAIEASSSKTSSNVTIPTEDMDWQSPFANPPLVTLSSNIKFSNSTEKYAYDRQVNRELVNVARKRLVKLICIIIMNSNHACNIMVYCLIGREFRRHFMCAIRRFIYGDSKYRQFYLNQNPQLQQQYQFNQQARQSLKARKLDDCDCILSTSSSARRQSTLKSTLKSSRRQQFRSEDDSQPSPQQQPEVSDRQKYRYKYKIPFKAKPAVQV